MSEKHIADAPLTLIPLATESAAMVCEGDVCYIPGLGSADAATPAADPEVTPGR